MAAKTLVSIILLSVFLLSATLAFSQSEKPLERCLEQCRRKTHGGSEERRCQEQCRSRHEERRGEQGRDVGLQWKHAEEKLRECERDCRKQEQGKQQRAYCERRCQEEYERERQHEGERGRGSNPRREEQEEEEESQETKSPYVFGRESFRHVVRTEHGHLRILRKFHEKSKLLTGIANYRLAILEANPNTFVMPGHWDADTVFYVVTGRGSISMLREENRESHDIRQGDIIWIPAGTIVYLTNKDNDEKLTIAKLLQSVSIPSEVQVFHGVGGENPKSFYTTFSDDVLQAALNTPRERIERVLRSQNKGVIFKASQEQLREIGRESGGGGRWPFGGESRGTFNLLRKRPTHSNQHGQLYEVNFNDYQPLKDIDIQVTFANISGGSMTAPFYNSKSTKIALVTKGRGYIEIVCPHLNRESQRGQEEQERQHGGGQREWEEEEERQRGEGQREQEEHGKQHGKEEEEEQQEQRQRYHKVRAEVRPGTVFVVPPGHPAVEVASRGELLQVVCFEIRAENNEKIWLAGQNNVLNQMERQAKELGFNVDAREVEQLLAAQRERVFLPGPEERERRQGQLANILDLAAF